MRRVALLFALLAVGVLLVWLLGRGDEVESGAVGRPERTRATPDLRSEDAAEAPPPSLVGHVPAEQEPPPSKDASARGAIRGVVYGPDGAPRAGQRVVLGPKGARRRTNGAGRFAFEDLEEGRYAVEVLAPPGLLADRREVTLGDGDLEVALRLTESSAFRIAVVDPDGAPVPGASVRIGRAHAEADAHGIAHVQDVHPDLEQFLLVAPPKARATAFFRSERRAWRPRDDRVVLERALDIRGRVLDEEGEPFRDATVAAEVPTQPGTWRSQKSGDDGAFRFVLLRPGTIRLRVEPPGTFFTEGSKVVEVEAGRHDVVLVAPRGASMTIRVGNWPREVLDRGRLGGIVLTPMDRPRERHSFPLGLEGEVHAVGLEAGTDYVLWGDFPTSARHYLYLEHVRPAEEVVVVHLEEGSTIRGRVVGPDEATQQSVLLQGLGVSKRAQVHPETGAFVLEGVPPGTWEIVGYGASGHLPRSRPRKTWLAKTTAAAGDDDVTLELKPYEGD